MPLAFLKKVESKGMRKDRIASTPPTAPASFEMIPEGHLL